MLDKEDIFDYTKSMYTNLSSFTGEAVMGQLVNHVPDLLYEKRMKDRHFVAECVKHGLSKDTAYRLIHGETNFNVETLKVVAVILDVPSISDVVDLVEQ